MKACAMLATAGVLCAAIFCYAGCGLIPQCAPPPSGDGICGPGTTCAGGPPEPVVDPRQDGAVDITQYSPTQIPAGVILNVPNEGRLHVGEDITPVYLYNPPASGPHYPTPAPTGYYCDVLREGFWVHSLEHGYIVILYQAPDGLAELLGSVLNPLLSIVPPSPTFGNRKLVITRYEPPAGVVNMPHPICVVAWDRELFLDLPDYGRILSFYQTYIDQGPELEE